MAFRIASFDIGKRNFAFFVQECDGNELENLWKNYKGKFIDFEFYRRLYQCGKTISFDRTEFCQKNEKLNIQIRKKLFSFLKSNLKLWKSCDVFIFEQQYLASPKGRRMQMNMEAIKIAEATLSWFLINFPQKENFVIPARFKTELLAAPKGIDKPKRKKWGVNQSYYILTFRGESEIIKQIEKEKKKDDICDCLIQAQGYLVHMLTSKNLFN